MKISLKWLREYVDYDGTPDALAELLTMAGVEVESIETRGANFDKVVVAQVISREQHPNADRLSVCRVDDGTHADPPRQIVCGATNFKAGDKVPLALPGAVLPGDVKIKVGKLRGVESEGMLCSAKELRIADDAVGLLILPASSPVGAPIGDLFPSDTIFDLEITPNRSDLLSHVGLAREVAALTGKTLRHPLDAMETPVGGDPVAHLPVIVAANAREACPFYTARFLDGVRVGPSPEWLRSKLEAVGVRAINNVVDVANFVMLELGQPLHAFDAASIGMAGLGVRLANTGEELLALDGRTYKLQPHQLVVARIDGKAEGLAGVMGGEESGVTARTTSLVLESAYFTPAGIRRTARELGLSSEASYRFERGVDPSGVMAASRRAEDLLLEICGGTSRGVTQTHVLPGQMEDLEPPISLRLDRCRQVLGTEISAERTEEILTGFGLEKTGEDLSEEATEWRVPSYRPDLRREIDLIEEVARVFGLDQVPGRVLGTFAPASTVDAAYDFLMGLRGRLVGMGFAETRSVSLVRAENGDGGVPLKNPLGEESAKLRGTLLSGLLASAGRNVRLGSANLRLFEVGRVFAPATPLGQPEPVAVGIVMTGGAAPESWRHGSEARTLDLHDLRGVLERLTDGGSVELRPQPPSGDGGMLALAAEVWVGGELAGTLGQLAPSRAKMLELRGDVLVLELQVEALRKIAEGGRTFLPLARFPSVTRDLAIVVDRTAANGEIVAALDGAGESLLSSVQLFDVFTDDKGEKIAAAKKSLAYSLTYRSETRTLTTEDVNAAHARLKAVLQGKFAGLQFRE